MTTKDLLYQPPVFGLLEGLYYFLCNEGKQNEKQLEKYFIEEQDTINNYLIPLEDLGLIKRENDTVQIVEGNVIKYWDKNPDTFSRYFKLQIISSIHTSPAKEIKYFSYFLESAFQVSLVTDEDIDRYLQEARKKVGIEDKTESMLVAKIDYTKQLLKYLGILYTHEIKSKKSQLYILLPQEILKLSLELAVSELIKSGANIHIDLYAQLFKKVSELYYPFLNEDRELLQSIQFAVTKNNQLSDKFTYVLTPDGGKEIRIHGSNYNQILVGGN